MSSEITQGCGRPAECNEAPALEGKVKDDRSGSQAMLSIDGAGMPAIEGRADSMFAMFDVIFLRCSAAPKSRKKAFSSIVKTKALLMALSFQKIIFLSKVKARRLAPDFSKNACQKDLSDSK